MEKNNIVETLVERVDSEIKSFESAVEQARSDACGAEMKSDGKYDTQAIEAGYLVGAQKKRIEELKLEKKMLEAIEIKTFSSSDEVAIGALVAIETNGTCREYFISPTAGGTMVNLGEKTILVISVFSPIGSEALGLFVGDIFELETKTGDRRYKIKSIT